MKTNLIDDLVKTGWEEGKNIWRYIDYSVDSNEIEFSGFFNEASKILKQNDILGVLVKDGDLLSYRVKRIFPNVEIEPYSMTYTSILGVEKQVFNLAKNKIKLKIDKFDQEKYFPIFRVSTMHSLDDEIEIVDVNLIEFSYGFDAEINLNKIPLLPVQISWAIASNIKLMDKKEIN